MKYQVLLFALTEILHGCASHSNAEVDKRISLDQIGRNLDGLKCESTEVVLTITKNIHDQNQNDRVVRLVCEGYQKEILITGDERNIRLPLKISVNSSAVFIAGGQIRIGMNETSLMAAIQKISGITPSIASNRFVIELNEERPESDLVTFLMDNGKIVKITWTWGID